ncbi:MAG: VWA domain-containing protein, partial [bacterium]
MRFDNSCFFLLFIPLFIFIWLKRHRINRVSLWLRVTAITLIILSLAKPQIIRKDTSLNVIFALDSSLSISNKSKEVGMQFIKMSLKEKDAKDKVGFITFADGAFTQSVLSKNPTLAVYSSPSPYSTDIESAINLSILLFPRYGNKKLILLTDGNETKGDALAGAYRAKSNNLEINVLPLTDIVSSEVTLEDVVLPKKVNINEPFLVKFLITSTTPQKATLYLSEDGKKILSDRLTLKKGRNLFLYTLSLSKVGFHRFRGELFPQRDTKKENNIVDSFTVVDGPSKVLYVYSGDPEKAFIESLRLQGIDLETSSPDRLPDIPVGFSGYSAVILDNIPATLLTLDQMKALQTFVKDIGGGLLVIGGPNSFGMGSYSDTPLEEVLPVESRIKQEAHLSDIALVLVIDASGSMSGQEGDLSKEELAKEAAQLVVDLLKDSDEVGIIAFDHSYQWIVPIISTKEKEKIEKEIAKIQPGGGTAMYPPLESAYQSLKDIKARVKHIIVLSDGQTEPGDFNSLIKKMRLSDITLSTVAVGTDADTNLMKNIAEWGNGRYYFTSDIFSIPQIFLTEALTSSRPYIVEKKFYPAINESDEFLKGIEKFPIFKGYVSTTLKPNAKQVLTALNKEPLLAQWRYGLGKVIAFTSDDGRRWGSDWVSAPIYSKFWSQIVRWISQETSPYHIVVSTYQKDENMKVSVDIIDSEGRFVNFLDGSLRVISPTGKIEEEKFSQVAPGRYMGEVSTREEGIYSLIARLGNDKVSVSKLDGFCIPSSPEMRKNGINNSILSQITEITGGHILASRENIFNNSGRKTSNIYTDIWQLVMLLGGIFFLSELVARKLLSILEQMRKIVEVLPRHTHLKISREAFSLYENASEPLESMARIKIKEESPINASS